MKNIIKVFLSDAKRLSTNVVALVIIMGLSIIPALYAWFNIISNWDVYGQSATSRMKIGVYSADAGFSYESLELNIGDKVVDGLKENTTIGWVFTDSEEEAIEGVYSGEYYAALVIPEDFTEDMISFLGGDLENPTIQYYENSKKNAIATKITSKAKKAVQETINTQFVETLAEVVTKSSEAVTGVETTDGSLMDTTLTQLKEMDTSLNTYINILDSLALVTDSASGLVSSSSALIPNVEGLVSASQGTVSSLQESVLSGAQAADSITQMMDYSIEVLDSNLDKLQQVADSQVTDLVYDYVQSMVNNNNIDFSDDVKTLESLETTLQTLQAVTPGADYSEVITEIETLKTDLNSLDQAMDDLEQSKDKTMDEVKALQEQLNVEITKTRTALQNLKSSFDNKIAPNLKNSVYHIESALIQTNSMLSSLNSDYDDVEDALDDYQETLDSGTDNISATSSYVSDIESKLADLIAGLEALNGNEQYQEFIQMFQNNPDVIATFISSPVELYTKAIYPIDSYGSQMAPFYTTLALWVGALLTMALVKVKVKPAPGIPRDLRPYQAYFGRFFTYFCIGGAQATITTLGDLFFVQIQCLHPFLFWVSSMCISLTFMLIMYSLTVALENIGEGAAVILLVIQVAGGGGTFPIEVLPTVFQAIYNFLPFKYAMGAMKECIGGFYQFDFAIDIGILGIYIFVCFFIGIVFAIPFRGLNRMIEESKKNSRVML